MVSTKTRVSARICCYLPNIDLAFRNSLKIISTPQQPPYYLYVRFVYKAQKIRFTRDND